MAKLKMTRFDAAEYLKFEKDCATFLEAAFESGDTAHIARALGVVARARGMMKLAQENRTHARGPVSHAIRRR